MSYECFRSWRFYCKWLAHWTWISAFEEKSFVQLPIRSFIPTWFVPFYFFFSSLIYFLSISSFPLLSVSFLFLLSISYLCFLFLFKVVKIYVRSIHKFVRTAYEYFASNPKSFLQRRHPHVVEEVSISYR